MQDLNTANQGDLIFKLDQDRAWLLENLDKGKWPEIRSELAALERKISKVIISVQENNVGIWFKKVFRQLQVLKANYPN